MACCRKSQRSDDLNNADYMLEELNAKTKAAVIQSHFTPKPQSMIEENPVLSILIEKLQLDEI